MLSLLARRRGDRGRGIQLSALAVGIAGFSAWVGGHLSFARGVGVNQTAFEELPSDWTPVTVDGELGDGTPVGARADGLAVVLVKRRDRVYALADRCSHRGCSLHDGVLNDDDTLTCPCHGSTFRLDGSIVRGPATSPQPSFEVRSDGGRLEIRSA
jgi:nitrite reductase/ring-hydroxylating ferredoxin subunit